ncbi:hypothetical protein HZC33_01175 [Candidatus Wolfebacteria bacterium]|nr:hypothetical protein [Candidatus Wolfebacteria bacterium]
MKNNASLPAGRQVCECVNKKTGTTIDSSAKDISDKERKEKEREDGKMKEAILILTNSEDGKHTDVVLEKLQQADQNVFRFDSDRFANGEIIIDFENNHRRCEFAMYSHDQVINSRNIKSVWYRRPNHFNLQIQDLVQRNYAEQEIKNLLDGLWTMVPDIFWLSNPKSLEQARKKLFQLKLARELGFLIPETIVTNDPNRVHEFFKTYNGKIVFKAFYHEFLNYGDRAFNIPTTLITEKHLEKLELVKKMPCLFQEFIDKKYELRITVVGQKIFPVKIYSQENSQTTVDWRNPEFINKLRYEVVSIPEALVKTCLTMLNELELSFGAFDFVVDKIGEIFFLEINPNGQWYWMESQTNVPISDAIVDILSLERR